MLSFCFIHYLKASRIPLKSYLFRLHSFAPRMAYDYANAPTTTITTTTTIRTTECVFISTCKCSVVVTVLCRTLWHACSCGFTLGAKVYTFNFVLKVNSSIAVRKIEWEISRLIDETILSMKLRVCQTIDTL